MLVPVGPSQAAAAVMPVQAAAAPAAAGAQGTQQQQQQPGPSAPELSESAKSLAHRKNELNRELVNLEKQIFELESTFLENSIGVGQALRGYPLSLTPSNTRKPAVKPTDRIFSGSSVTGAS